MCGIFGVIARPDKFSRCDVERAIDFLGHRGPDDTGIERIIVSEWEIWLAHKRLSILDLSPQGHQPMFGRARDGREGWITYNGEAYNSDRLKKDLSNSWYFRSTTDTEVVLAGVVLHGPSFLEYLNSMMAFAVLNTTDRTMLIARDRLGKKPLYLYSTPHVLVFASELKAIRALGVPLSVNPEAVVYYRWLGYIPSHLTVYKECTKLCTGSFAEIDLQATGLRPLNLKQYWDPLVGYSRSFDGSYYDAIDEFLRLLDDATNIRLTADVPVGAFLSGGIDSSLVVCSIQKARSGRAKAFTVRFQDAGLDESPVAISTAHQLGIEIEVLNLRSEDFARQVQKIPYHYDEPFSDSSQIPTLAIAEAARRKVTVILTGDGGDEIFLGYPRYLYSLKLDRARTIAKRLLGVDRVLLSAMNTSLGERFLQALARNRRADVSRLESAARRIRTTLRAETFSEVYDAVMSVRQRDDLSSTDQELLSRKTLQSLVKEWYPDYGWDAMESRTPEEQLAAIDLVTFLRDDVLVKLDRATMAYGLEARCPLLDYRIIEFGTSLPLGFKLSRGLGKRILRDVLARRLKGKTSRLPKSGFSTPLPKELPVGPDPQAQWNVFVEQQWSQLFGVSL